MDWADYSSGKPLDKVDHIRAIARLLCIVNNRDIVSLLYKDVLSRPFSSRDPGALLNFGGLRFVCYISKVGRLRKTEATGKRQHSIRKLALIC